MGIPYIGEIRMFAGNFAPNGWEICAGQLIAISENDALFTLIGTTYGGDGQSTFGLPDLRGRLPVHQGQGPGLSSYILGQFAGTEQVTLTTTQIPNHTHAFLGSTNLGNTPNPAGNLLAQSTAIDAYINEDPAAALRAGSIVPIGGSQPHDNRMPSLAINFIISLYGIFPSQT